MLHVLATWLAQPAAASPPPEATSPPPEAAAPPPEAAVPAPGAASPVPEAASTAPDAALPTPEADATRPDLPPAALARLEGRSGVDLRGIVHVELHPAVGLRVQLRLDGAPPGNHAVFLHEGGDCSAADASSAGGYHPGDLRGTDPEGASTPPAPPPGYLGYVTVDAEGRGEQRFDLRGARAAEGVRALLDRALVVYERAPDFTRDPDPGARIACGTLRAAPGAPIGTE